MAEPDVVIVGGGVSGLSTAYFLARQGISSVLLERSNRLGGLIQTHLADGCQLEAGPDSYIASKPAVTDLAQDLPDLKDQIIGSNDLQRRIFIARNGKLIRFPEGMVMMVPGRWLPALRSNLFSTGTKLRFLRETALRPRHRTRDVSIHSFISEHFGREVLEYVTEPLLSGIYGGDAGVLSADSVLPQFVRYERRYGSLIRGVRRERARGSRPASAFLSFQGGMQTLTDSIAQALPILRRVVHHQVTRVERSGSRWRILAGNERLDAAHIVLACPAHVAGELLQACEPHLAAQLAKIPYSSAILVNLVHEQSRVKPDFDGFGFLVPVAERRTVAAVTCVSTKFPSRARPGALVFRAFILGKTADELMQAPDEDLFHLAGQDLNAWIGIDAPPVMNMLHRWPQSMPQYMVGHAERQHLITQMVRASRGLHLVGNSYDGVGIPDCVRLAKDAASRIITAMLGRVRTS